MKEKINTMQIICKNSITTATDAVLVAMLIDEDITTIDTAVTRYHFGENISYYALNTMIFLCFTELKYTIAQVARHYGVPFGIVKRTCLELAIRYKNDPDYRGYINALRLYIKLKKLV